MLDLLIRLAPGYIQRQRAAVNRLKADKGASLWRRNQRFGLFASPGRKFLGFHCRRMTAGLAFWHAPAIQEKFMGGSGSMSVGQEAGGQSRRPQCPQPKEWLSPCTAEGLALIIILLLFVAYPKVVLGTHSFFYRDFGLFTYPTAQFARDSFWNGSLPLWNSLNNSGVPFLAQWNTTVCYPLSLLYLVLPLPWSLNYFCLGHLLLAGLGMYRLALRWTGDPLAASVGGLAFALNGLSFNCLMWTSNLGALAGMPWVLLSAERACREGGKAVVWAALIGATQMLAGAPEIILMTWLLVAALWLEQVWCKAIPLRPSFARLLAVGVLVLGLSAVQVLPFVELLGYSDRGGSQANLDWSMPFWGWANFLVPMFRCTPLVMGTSIQVEQQWTSSYYVPVAVLALAVVGGWRERTPRVRWLAIAAVMGTVLALGDKALAHKVLVRLVPLLGLVRYPIKFVVLTVFAVPMVAAFGVAWINKRPLATVSPAGRSLGLVGAVLGIVVVAIVACSKLFPYAGEVWTTTLMNGVGRLLCLGLAMAIVLLLVRSVQPARRRWLGFGLLIVVGLDAVTHVPRQNPTVPNVAYTASPLQMSSRPAVGESRAMIDPSMEALLLKALERDPLAFYREMRSALFADCNLLDRVPRVGGFYSLALRPEAAVATLLSSHTNLAPGLLDFLGVSQISSTNLPLGWNERTTALPWATAGQQPVFADAPATYQGLGAPEFDPRRVVYLPLEAQSLVGTSVASATKIVSAQFSPQKVVVEVNAPQPALVVVAQTYYPAWQATVDDKPVTLWRANLAFQAVEVPQGYHRVVVRYRDQFFYVGSVLSLFSLALCCVLWFLNRASRARSE
jgi:hypothetical protein